MRLRLLCAALVLAGAVACEDRAAGGKRPRNVVAVEEGDPEMNAAVAKAQETLPQFISALQLPAPNQSDFTIKIGFKDGEDTEYMWLSPVTYDGAQFKGKLDNDPVSVRNVKIGDEITVGPDRVVDWMYVQDGKLVGGYTLRVLRDRMSPQQRRQYDQSRSFKIE